MAPLTAAFVQRVRESGRHGDGRGGHGLYLRVYVRKNGRVAKSWGQRVRIAGKTTNLGLGVFPIVSLSEARKAALHNRREIAQGRDPRRGKVPTFAEASERVIRLHAPGWKNSKRVSTKWRQTLRDYAFPVFGRKAVSEVTSADILGALSPIWASKPATAKVVRQRVGAVLKWSVASGFRPDNPAGASLTAALPRQNGRVRHHAALPHREVSGALAKIRAAKSRAKAARLAYELCALTACRASEAREAKWSEIDREARLWTIPARRMKGRREHRVPLSDAALEVLREARNLGSAIWIFPSPQTGEPLTPNVLQSLAQRTGATVHGLRSSFRSWCGDSGVPREVAEECLSHRLGSAVELAYNRTDLLERRRRVMSGWADYLAG